MLLGVILKIVQTAFKVQHNSICEGSIIHTSMQNKKHIGRTSNWAPLKERYTVQVE